MSHYTLTAEHIQKKYNGRIILHDVSIHVEKGGIYGLVGKNGSGKTTLLKILTGQIQRYSGTVSIEEDKQKIRVSAVINSPALFLNFNAFENMKEQSLLLGKRDDSKIRDILITVGLEDCKHKLVRDYSLGMAQRLRLALALLGDPNILILDEPVNGLDPDGIADLRELLLRLNHMNSITIIISSHILSELEQITTCLGILHDGKIVKEVSIEDVLQDGNTLEALYMQYTRGGK